MAESFLRQYHEAITSGKAIVGYWIRKEVENLIADLDDPRFYYDVREAHRRFAFQERFCLQSNAPYYMKPMSLMLWQKAFWEALYSFRMADTRKRRFTEALLEVARKNGKTTMFAADGMTDLFIGPGGVSICCASNDDKQAKLIWDEIGGMRGRLDPKKEVTGQNLVKIRNEQRNISIFRLSSRTQNKDGYNIDKTYLDESHDIDEDNAASEIAEACWRGMSSKDEPLFLNCTTQGFNRGCYLDNKIKIAKMVIDGELDNPHFLPFLYEQDSEAEVWQDEATWEKSNPSIPYGVKKVGKLRQDIETSKIDVGSRVHMLCKDFNIPQNTSAAWLQLDDYMYDQQDWSLEDFRDCFCLAAADLSETTDLTNVKLLLMRPNDQRKFVYSHYWIPESKMTATPDKEAGAKYKEWAKAGLLTVCEGNDNDLAQVADWVAGLKNRYGIRVVKLGYDVRFAKEFIKRLDDYGIETEIIQQNPAVMSTPMKLVEADLKGRLIEYGANEMDRWCLGNASIQVNNSGQVMCVKADGKSQRRIDGAVTLIILYATLQRFRSEFLKYVK